MHLFQKNLSKLSVGVYIQLIQSVNKSFKAIPRTSCAKDGVVIKHINQSGFIPNQEVNQSNLQSASSSLKQVIDWQSVAEAETFARQSAESELMMWKSRVQTLLRVHQELLCISE